MSKKKNNYLIQVTIQNETVQKHPTRQDRQLHPDGHHRLRIHLPHAVVQELEGVRRSKKELEGVGRSRKSIDLLLLILLPDMGII